MDFKDDKQLDDRLATYVDALTAGQNPTFDEDNEELRELQEATSLLWEAFSTLYPEQAMSQRIWENLELEWQEKQQEEATTIPFTRRMRSYTSAFAAAAAVAILIFAALFITGGGEVAIPGSALGAGNLALPLVLLVLIGVAIYVYSKREG